MEETFFINIAMLIITLKTLIIGNRNGMREICKNIKEKISEE